MLPKYFTCPSFSIFHQLSFLPVSLWLPYLEKDQKKENIKVFNNHNQAYYEESGIHLGQTGRNRAFIWVKQRNRVFIWVELDCNLGLVDFTSIRDFYMDKSWFYASPVLDDIMLSKCPLVNHKSSLWHACTSWTWLTDNNIDMWQAFGWYCVITDMWHWTIWCYDWHVTPNSMWHSLHIFHSLLFKAQTMLYRFTQVNSKCKLSTITHIQANNLAAFFATEWLQTAQQCSCKNWLHL